MQSISVKGPTEFTGVTQYFTVLVYSCHCPPGWKGTLCTERVSVCDHEHSPPPLCAHGSICIPLPNGYTCQCPLGTAGLHCETGCNIEPTNRFFLLTFLRSIFSPCTFLHFVILQLETAVYFYLCFIGKKQVLSCEFFYIQMVASVNATSICRKQKTCRKTCSS